MGTRDVHFRRFAAFVHGRRAAALRRTFELWRVALVLRRTDQFLSRMGARLTLWFTPCAGTEPVAGLLAAPVRPRTGRAVGPPWRVGAWASLASLLWSPADLPRLGAAKNNESRT